VTGKHSDHVGISRVVVATGALSPRLVWYYSHEFGYWRLPDHVEVLCVLEPRQFGPNGVERAVSGECLACIQTAVMTRMTVNC